MWNTAGLRGGSALVSAGISITVYPQWIYSVKPREHGGPKTGIWYFDIPVGEDGTVPSVARRWPTADIINAAMASLKGTTLVIGSPKDLVKAIAVVRRSR
jgi:hypothetical protein